VEPGDGYRQLPSGHDYVVENIAASASRWQGTAGAGRANLDWVGQSKVTRLFDYDGEWRRPILPENERGGRTKTIA
jgi:hypothetical protein